MIWYIASFLLFWSFCFSFVFYKKTKEELDDVKSELVKFQLKAIEDVNNKEKVAANECKDFNKQRNETPKNETPKNETPKNEGNAEPHSIEKGDVYMCGTQDNPFSKPIFMVVTDIKMGSDKRMYVKYSFLYENDTFRIGGVSDNSTNLESFVRWYKYVRHINIK